MPDIVNILKRVQEMDTSPQFYGYSGVRIYVGTDDDGTPIVYEAGNESGRVLEIKNEFGTQQMAENILEEIRGYQYQPLEARDAYLDPAAEMGDGITVNGVYSGIFVRATNFGSLMAADVSAPTDEEIEHEFAVETPSDRQYTRWVAQTKAALRITNMAIEAEVEAREAANEEIRATLSLQADEIEAKVSKQSPEGSTSFGWNLTDTQWTLFNESGNILTATSSGLAVKGRIEADEGYIGGENGFTITASKIYKNIQSMDSAASTGVYIGTDGIRLGSGFRVDSSGNLYATSGTFTGNVYAGRISYGGSAGTFNGGGISGGTVGTGQVTSGINGSLGYANFANGVFSNVNTANYIRCTYLIVANAQYYSSAITYMTPSGESETAYVLRHF